MSSYIKLSTLQFPFHIGDIKLDPAGAADYAHVEWVDQPEYDPETQRCVAGPPERIDGVWHWTWLVRPATPEEIKAAEEAKKLFIFKGRNQMQNDILKRS